MFQLFYFPNSLAIETFQATSDVRIMSQDECLMMDIDTDVSSPELEILIYERRSLTSAVRGLEKRINMDELKLEYEEKINRKICNSLKGRKKKVQTLHATIKKDKEFMKTLSNKAEWKTNIINIVRKEIGRKLFID